MAQYETVLTPDEEQQFQRWKQQYAPKDSGADYDLRGAFKAGLRPDPQSGHWPDTYKKPNHPTFSNESIYAKDAPERAGSWQGETYIPATGSRPQMTIPPDVQDRIQRNWNTMPPDVQDRLTRAGFTLPTTTPTTTGDLMPRLLRAAPAVAGGVAGASRGAALGAPIAPPWGALIGGATGGALGAMGGETALGLGQKALGIPQGQAPMLPRVAEAGRQGFTGGITSGILGPAIQKGLEGLGNIGSRLASRIGAPGRYGIQAGAGEETAAGMAGTRGAAGVVRKAAERQGSQIAQAGQRILDDMGIEARQSLMTTRAVRDLRTALRDVMTTGTRRGAEAYPAAGPLIEGIPTRLGKVGQGVAPAARQTTEQIERYIESTVSEARVAEEIAKHPAAWDALLAQTGTPAHQGLGAQSWWTTKLVEATGKKGLQKGILDAGKVVAEFDKLEPGQASRMFGDKLPAVSRFIDTLRGLPLGGAVPEKVAPINWTTILGGGGLGALAKGNISGAVTGAGGVLTARLIGPFIAAKMLTSADGAAMLTQMLTSSLVSGAAEIAPTAASIGAQTYTQTQPAP